MRIAVFSTRSYDQEFLSAANASQEVGGHELVFLETPLTEATAGLAKGFTAICCFVNDHLGAPVLRALVDGGTRHIALRSAGFNHVDLVAAGGLGLTVTRVPAYSPYAVAEHTVGLILALDRKIHRAYTRVREGNFALGRPVGIRHPRPHRGHHRHRQDRQRGSAHIQRFRLHTAG